MNSKMKRRMVAVTGVIVIVVVVVLAVVGGTSSAKTVSVADAASGSFGDRKIQVSGTVVENSFSVKDNTLVFSVYDKEADPSASTQLRVRYEGGVSSTFGNDVVAICTGKIDADGVLQCSELVTKCPSKYENSTDSLSVSRLMGYADSVRNKPVKVAGQMKEGTLGVAGGDRRFVVVDPDTGDEMPVKYDGALSDETTEGSSLILTGSINDQDVFVATEVALEG
ncbi:cytochrome C biogenesis protein [Berryella intestinalis]|uniref:Cytochrome C biogenesis protein n=1 Tax=Berryella intestinalis TaxID=1531429 RepID=A0A0A8B517_9ACTN|nr:cytochrome c maturation protein CcmE [Berryella intestinalis]AJC12500.1 cytochrome C biogenesis protein [Berryella intestinalis]